MMEAGLYNKLDKGEIVEYEADPLEIVQYETDPLALRVPNKIKCQSEMFDGEIKCEEFIYGESSDERNKNCEDFINGEGSDERMKKIEEFSYGDERFNKRKEFSYDESSDERINREIYKYEDNGDKHEVMESDGVRKRVKVSNSDGEMLVHVEINKSSRNKNGNSNSTEGHTPCSVITPAKIVRPQCHQCQKVVFSIHAVMPQFGMKKFLCSSCEKNNLQLNSIIKQLHQCEVCEKGFANQGALAQHSCIDSPRQLPVYIACDECDQIFRYKKDLYQHNAKDHSRVNYKCSYCPEGFHYKTDLNQHLASVHLSDKYKCNKCGEGFAYHKDLMQHSITIHADFKHECNQCNKRFRSINPLLTHLVKEHGSSKKHKCDDCSELFSSKRQLSVHQGAVHSKARNINQ